MAADNVVAPGYPAFRVPKKDGGEASLEWTVEAKRAQPSGTLTLCCGNAVCPEYFHASTESYSCRRAGLGATRSNVREQRQLFNFRRTAEVVDAKAE